jgi:hypothetical protein
LKEFKVSFKAAEKKGALIDKYKLLIASKQAKSWEALASKSATHSHINHTQENSQLPPNSEDTPTTAGMNDISERQNWPGRCCYIFPTFCCLLYS